MSDCIDFAAMLTEVGGWDTPLPFGLDCATARLGDGFHFEQRDDEQTNITSTTSSEPSEEQIGAQFNNNSAQDNKKLEPKEQVNEESIFEKNDEAMPQAWAESQGPKVVSQTWQEEAVSIDSHKTDSQEQAWQDHDQQKGFFNKWVIGSLLLGAAAIVGICYINKK